jgi:hypothetical protein
MSRRITVFVLAASAALTATQARADRECFENSCHLQQAVEPAATPVAAADSQVAADTSARKVAVAPAPEPPRVPQLSPTKSRGSARGDSAHSDLSKEQRGASPRHGAGSRGHTARRCDA